MVVTTTSSSTNNNVLIIGGGLAGLALANVLKYQGVPYKVFERDASPDNRSQGFSLSMHFCLEALKSSMDPVKYATLGEKSAVDRDYPNRADACLVDGNTGERLFMFPSESSSHDVFRVNRERFRNWLLEDIDVEWNKRIDHYTIITHNGGRKVKVTFTDGTVEYGSVLVGADGVNSQVYRQLIGSEAYDQSTSVNPVKILNGSYWIDSTFRREIENTLSYSHMMGSACANEDASHSICLFVSLLDHDPARKEQEDKPYEMLWSISSVDQEEPNYETDHEKLKQAKDWIHQSGFKGLLRRLVLETPEDTKVTALQVVERSPHPKMDTLRGDPVVLIGDSIHKMSQFRGIAGNHAILDACLLGMELTRVYKGDTSLDQAIDTYYKEMLPRGRNAVEESHQAVEIMHASRAQINGFIYAMANKATDKQEKN
ncbi:hypothetical protein BDA99DRAFT_527537 [Phascolomyces articulosus]|uniref:FAD-binding domain-containing protein n=1 Tax=Phascolomyces articulosus TaxID=60185 RepID=A0AAD5JMW0_9FUNG|nr:hypothetical protein BDA99DRAFT_527537 [Phascolomyces articulosus]